MFDDQKCVKPTTKVVTCSFTVLLIDDLYKSKPSQGTLSPTLRIICLV